MLVALLMMVLAFPYSWEEQGVRITLVNPEVTPDRHYVLVHLRLQPTMDIAAFRWQNLCTVVNKAGQPLPQANDCGVNEHITMGDFPLKKNQRSSLMIYYLAQPADFPVQIFVGDAPVGRPLGR